MSAMLSDDENKFFEIYFSQCCGSVRFSDGSGSGSDLEKKTDPDPDPGTDPDPDPAKNMTSLKIQ